MNKPSSLDSNLDQNLMETYDVVPTLKKLGSVEYQKLLQDPVIQNDIETTDPEDFASLILGSVQINYADFILPQKNSGSAAEPLIVPENEKK